MNQKTTLVVCLLSLFTLIPLGVGANAAPVAISLASAAVNDDKADLQTYYNDVSAKFESMTDATYDDAAFTEAQREALEAALQKAAEALAASTADYAAVLAELKEVYEKVPYVEGGKKWWAITVDDLTDGAEVMFECGPTSYHGRFMKAYPTNGNQNSVMCNDEGKSRSVIWKLVATGNYDAIYTSKPTYYLQDVTSGKYIGVSDVLTSTDQGHKRMVDATDMAFEFCFLKAGEINSQEGRNMNVYGNSDAVFIQHSNADGTWFRLSRFGAYSQVYYISTTTYPTNNDWQAWNVYTGESDLSMRGELEQAVEQYGGLVLPAGSAPGYYNEADVAPYNTALEKANGVSESTTRQEMRDIIDSLASAYETAKSLTPNDISEGYYRLKSAYTNFTSQNKTMCAYDRSDGYLGWHTMDAALPVNVFKFKKVDGGWSVQNAATGKFVGVAVNENKITMTDTMASVQTFASQGSGQWRWSNKSTSFTYYTVGSDPGYVGRYYNQQGLGTFDSWVFEPVDKDWIEEITIGVALDSLKAYYNSMSANVAPYVNANDYDADKVAAFEAAYKAAGDAVNGGEYSYNELNTLLDNLKNAYSALGFANGGAVKTLERLSCSDIKDGSVIAIEAATTKDLEGYFLKGQTQYRNGLYAWVFKPGLDADGVWEVEATPLVDKKNGKPTFYIKQQSTGLYIGKNGTGTNGYQTRALVAHTDSAYNFSLVTPAEAGCTTYNGQKNWDENSVTFQYANSADHAMNLCNYPASPTFVWVFEGSTDVIAWNVYGVESSKTLEEEFEKLMTRCEALQPETTGGIGFYEPELAEKYLEAYGAAKALTSENSRMDYRKAIDRLDSAYNNMIKAGLAPVSSGYYYITNRYGAYKEANGAYAELAAQDGDALWQKFAPQAYKSVWHVTGTDAGYTVENMLSGKYLAVGLDGTLTVSDDNTDKFAISLLGLYKASLAKAGTEELFAIGADATGKAAVNAGGAEWTFVKVADSELSEVLRQCAHSKLSALVAEAGEYTASLGQNKYDAEKEAAFKSSLAAAQSLLEASSATATQLDAAREQLSQDFIALKDSRKYEEGTPIALLAEYVADIKENIPHISEKYYDKAAVDALLPVWDEAVDAVAKENLDSAGYTDVLKRLKETYEAVGYVYGGYYPRIDASSLHDGSLVMIEAASSRYNLGAYLKQNAAGNHVFTEGRDSRSIWKLIDAGKADKINSRTTYYLQNVETGQYIGYNSSYTNRAMVSSLDNAMNFSILTPDDITFTGYLDGTTGADANSVAFQFSYSDSKFVRLGNFIAYGDYAYYVTEDSWKHVVAWNLYSATFEDDIEGEYRETLDKFKYIRVSGDDSPGSYPEDVAQSYSDALAFAKDAAGSTTRIAFRTAIDSLTNAFARVSATKENGITEGYYYLRSNFYDFVDNGLDMAARNGELGMTWSELDRISPEFIFKFTNTGNGWLVQNMASSKYVGADNGSIVAMITGTNVGQAFEYIGGGQYAWSNSSSANTYYPYGYTGDNGNVRAGSSHKSYGSVDSWTISRVPQDIIDSINITGTPKFMNRTLVIEGKAKINWIRAMARNVGQLNIMAIDTRNATLDADVTYETLSKVSSAENCLYYVSASQGIHGPNVVVDSVCENLQLVDAPYYCPEAFKAKSATYSVNPSYATASGGWQTIALPFEATSASASTAGDINIETADANGRVFVREFTGIEESTINFARLAEPKIKAFTPYALAVPGEEFGDKSLEGETITFAATNVAVDTIPASASVTQGNYSFVATYENSPVSRAWILNYEGNGFETWTNGSPLCFRGYFTAADSELYDQSEFAFSLEGEAASRKLIRVAGLSLDNELTDIKPAAKSSTTIAATRGGLVISAEKPVKVTIFDAEGKLVFGETISGQRTISLARGVYIVNNRKVLVHN